MIAPETVRTTAQGYLITLRKDQHKQLIEARTYFIPYGDSKIKQSGDDAFHLCIHSISKEALCFYVPPSGV